MVDDIGLFHITFQWAVYKKRY